MKRTLVLGATSRIASEVVKLYAARGDELLLVGRNADKLAALGESLGSGRAKSIVADFDRTDEIEGLVTRCLDELGGEVDEVLVAHGELGDQLATERSFHDAEAILRTNFLSVVALLIPLVNHMESRKKGRLGVITSVAGDRGVRPPS